MGNSPEYSRAYALTHQIAIRKRRRLYYLKNRERLLAYQTEYNRKTLARRRAARASQKPVRESVRGMSSADNNSSRDTSPVEWDKLSDDQEHGVSVLDMPRAGASDGTEKDGGVPARKKKSRSTHTRKGR